MPANPLVTPADLAASIQQEIPSAPAPQAAHADEAIRAASAAVRRAAGQPDDAWPTPELVPEIARTICLRAASRLFLNPQQRTSFAGPNGLTWSGSPTRILTEEERADLAPSPSRLRMGTIPISSWLA